MVEKAVQCQSCGELADCAQSFRSQVCPGTPKKHMSPQRQSSPAPSPEQAERFMELRMAELEMSRMLLLEGLEKERMELLRLQSAKAKSEGHVLSPLSVFDMS